MNIDSGEINTSLIMMRECWIISKGYDEVVEELMARQNASIVSKYSMRAFESAPTYVYIYFITFIAESERSV